MSKCKVCQKKITLAQQVASLCKCGNYHCSKHMHSDSHSCNKLDDIILDNKNKLAQTLNKVCAEKMIKIQ